MERLKLDLAQLHKALKTLHDSFEVAREAQEAASVRFILAAEDSIIQRFEYSYESFWKFLKKYFETLCNMEELNSPRKVFRACVKVGICTAEEVDILIDMADARNETSHTYNIESTRIILVDVPYYYACMMSVVERLETTLMIEI